MLIKFIVGLVSLIIPVRRKLYIFGSWSAKRYGDNTRYFYEYLSNVSDTYQVYWYTDNESVNEYLKGKGLQTIYGFSLRAIWLHIRAEAIFCNCHQNTDLLGNYINSKTKVFNLWHGTPMKFIGSDAIKSGIGDLCIDRSGNFKRLFVKKVKSFLECIGLSNKIYYLASSEAVASCLKSAFNLNDDNIIIAPYPKLKLDILKNENSNNINILFAPTYRGKYNSENDILTTHGFSVDRVDAWLERENAILFIRLHPANRLPDSIIRMINNSNYIHIDTSADIYERFSIYDVVITDFSSVYFDAIATKKLSLLCPMGFSDYLKNDRDLYYQPEFLFPFRLSYSWDELINNYDYYKLLKESDFFDLRDIFYPHDVKENPSELLLKAIKCILKD
ncbi:CDP-glycerol glycerophosphotransferase family protein [Vibrio cholerae]|uniref:CDP-glycerol glycerophosphotransferase family protein n=1 Tax=Vibrio cholerae TaxID=666 RepID=UPI000E0A6D3D|nr:CDP-glycerol glycerophosphotransferase family protein [Vibrio cholerae]